MSDGGTRSTAPRRSRSIAVYLLVLALVAFVPVMAFAAVLLQQNNQAQQEVVETLTAATTQAIGQAVDRQIEGMTTTLKFLASSPSMGTGDYADLHRRGQSALEGTGAYLVLIDRTFQQLFNTRVPFGTPLGKSANSVTIQKALDTRQVAVSGVAYGPTAGAWVIPVFMPVVLREGLPGVLVITQNANNLASALLEGQIPNGWQVALVDADNAVIAASDGSGVEQGKPLFIAPASIGANKGWTREHVGNADFVAIKWTSPKTGWSAVAWAPAATVERPLSNSLLLLIAGGIVIVAAAGITNFFIGREIQRSVRGLARDAKRLGLGEPVSAKDYPISEIATVSSAIGEAARRRQSADAEVRFLMRELAHRSKNQMTVIAAMAKQTARGAASLPDFVQSFEKRILGLARSTDLLLANGLAGVDLRELFASQIDPFCPIDSGRVTLRGDSFRLNTHAAPILGMAAHELATNAVKYGALSREDGTLEVSWVHSGERVDLVWREHVAGLPERPEHRGFGTTVIENMVGSSLQAEVTRTVHPDGIEWRFDIPFAALDPDRPVEGAETEAEAKAAPAAAPPVTRTEQPLQAK
ncbi:MAG: chemotaxis protein methyltransferase CheR [Hyphomicrobiales bacterium]|nr:chemotaxis protein methyltransferase CheR [Hyphomicrobiales bacterium]